MFLVEQLAEQHADAQRAIAAEIRAVTGRDDPRLPIGSPPFTLDDLTPAAMSALLRARYEQLGRGSGKKNTTWLEELGL
jgi:hypothetical protein